MISAFVRIGQIVILVGIISFSITRLKQGLLDIGATALSRWNHKFLDYEIETNQSKSHHHNQGNRVGIISFSITRLKQSYNNYVFGFVYVGIISFSITRLKRMTLMACFSPRNAKLES